MPSLSTVRDYVVGTLSGLFTVLIWNNGDHLIAIAFAFLALSNIALVIATRAAISMLTVQLLSIATEVRNR